MSDRLIGLIGGTGLGQALSEKLFGRSEQEETPFGPPSAPIVRGRWNGVEIAFLPRHGVHHTLPPSAVPYRANIYALKALGVTHIIASGATGSLREEMRPRDLVLPDQVIDKTMRRSSSFFDEPGIAAHVEFSHPFCPTLRSLLLRAVAEVDVRVHDGGTYVCMEGPAFSTVAESRMHRSWGGDLIGMTVMPEAKLAREAEICYALIALPTDYDCWQPHDPSMSKQALLREILNNVKEATAESVKLIEAALKLTAAGGLMPCACQSALDLAIWTQREEISPEIAVRLSVILARYLAGR